MEGRASGERDSDRIAAGSFRDNITNLSRAMEYLEAHK